MDARVTEFAASQVKARFSEMLDRAEAGEELTIRRHGRVVARLSPATESEDEAIARRRQTRLAFIAWREANGPTLGPDLTVRDLINDGRH